MPVQPPGVKRLAQTPGDDRATGQEAVMTNYVSPLLFIVLLVPGALIAGRLALTNPPAAIALLAVWVIAASVAASAIRLAAEWERAVVFRLGKFQQVKGPGLFLIVPLIDQLRRIDTRVQTIQIARQQVITKDNVPVSIDAVLFFRVERAADAVIKVQDFRFAVSQYARTSLRDVIGQMTLDQLLAEREQIETAIARHVERDTGEWGLQVVGIRMEDIDMPEELKKMMSRQASAEREKRANITKAEGDKEAAVNLAAAAGTMAASPGAMHLRTLQTIDGLGPSASNTVVLALPVELMEIVTSLKDTLKPPRAA
jgi:regulator of protease activity HflC (stomatin/prohibitin superfamily)